MNDFQKRQAAKILATYGYQPSSNNSLHTEDNTFEKGGKSAQIGEVREWAGKSFKKQANGKWLEIDKKIGLSKKEHQQIIKKTSDASTLKRREEEDKMGNMYESVDPYTGKKTLVERPPDVNPHTGKTEPFDRNKHRDHIEAPVFTDKEKKILEEKHDHYNLQHHLHEKEFEDSDFKDLKGQKTIGLTESGKPIFADYKNPEHKNFTQGDHLDAWRLHANQKDKQNTETGLSKKHHAEQAKLHDKHYKMNNYENGRSGWGHKLKGEKSLNQAKEKSKVLREELKQHGLLD